MSKSKIDENKTKPSIYTADSRLNLQAQPHIAVNWQTAVVLQYIECRATTNTNTEYATSAELDTSIR